MNSQIPSPSAILKYRPEINLARIKSGVLMFIYGGFVALAFYKFLGAGVDQSVTQFAIVLVKVAVVATLIAYFFKPLGDFFVSQPKENHDESTET